MCTGRGGATPTCVSFLALSDDGAVGVGVSEDVGRVLFGRPPGRYESLCLPDDGSASDLDP